MLGLFKGLGATLWRESLGNMAMFGTYEAVKQQMVAAKVGHRAKARGAGWSVALCLARPIALPACAHAHLQSGALRLL